MLVTTLCAQLREAAEALGISEATAVRWWTYARAWLVEDVANEKR